MMGGFDGGFGLPCEKCWGGYGLFTVTGDLRGVSGAAFLQPGAKTPVLVRFGVLAGERGMADALRAPRLFTVRFFTADGVWDLAAGSTPAFPLRDYGGNTPAARACWRALGRQAGSGLPSRAAQWAYYAAHPETLCYLTNLLSPLGRPPSLRAADGFGYTVFALYAQGAGRRWGRFTLQSCQPGARAVGGARDPDAFGMDLMAAIDRGDAPAWRLCLQTMTGVQAAAAEADPFDATMPWDTAVYPPRAVGLLRLTRLPQNHFAELEAARFTDNRRARLPGIAPAPPWGGWGRGEDYTAAGAFYRTLPPEARASLAETTAASLRGMGEKSCTLHAARCYRADAGYGVAVTQALSLDLCRVRRRAGTL